MAADLLTPTQAAALIGVSVRTLQRYAERADFPRPIRPGWGQRTVLYRRSDLICWTQQAA